MYTLGPVLGRHPAPVVSTISAGNSPPLPLSFSSASSRVPSSCWNVSTAPLSALVPSGSRPLSPTVTHLRPPRPTSIPLDHLKPQGILVEVHGSLDACDRYL